MELPSKVKKASKVDPRRMIIGSLPKIGKSSLAAELTKTGGWLLVDMENGSGFIDAMSC